MPISYSYFLEHNLAEIILYCHLISLGHKSTCNYQFLSHSQVPATNIHSFTVIMNKQTHFKPFDTKFKIVFQHKTVVTPCEAPLIPTFGLRFCDFASITQASINNKFLIGICPCTFFWTNVIYWLLSDLTSSYLFTKCRCRRRHHLDEQATQSIRAPIITETSTSTSSLTIFSNTLMPNSWKYFFVLRCFKFFFLLLHFLHCNVHVFPEAPNLNVLCGLSTLINLSTTWNSTSRGCILLSYNFERPKLSLVSYLNSLICLVKQHVLLMKLCFPLGEWPYICRVIETYVVMLYSYSLEIF